MRASVSRRLLPQLAVLGNDSRATERRGCAFEPMSSQIYAILARAALVSWESWLSPRETSRIASMKVPNS